MFAVIFGRPGCPYCVRAKELAEKLTEERDDFNFRYIDIHAEGITKADLEKPSVNLLKPFHRSSSIRNILAAALILKPTLKKIWLCSSNRFLLRKRASIWMPFYFIYQNVVSF